MSVVVDSSAWIEWLTDSEIGRHLSSDMPAPEACIVPAIVQYEVVRWLRREADEERADAFLAYTMQCRVEPLDTETAMIAVSLAEEHKLAMADAMVLATARKAGAILLTCDAHFDGIPSVTLVRKTGR